MKKGKYQIYDVGVTIKQRYGEWLGNIYTPNILEARSTEYPRTQMSLELLLAGLWPPVEDQIWNQALNWQPIPFNSESKSKLEVSYYKIMKHAHSIML